MDFLDSLDLDTSHRKSHRVRSWYLYEQFKSLEKNQRDAAQKLKDKSYQEKILRKELSERRARRKLYDQFGLCQSESNIERSIKSDSIKSSLIMSTGNEDFYETFSEYQDDDQVIHIKDHDLSDDNFSQDDSIADKSCMDDFKSVEDLKDDNSYEESVNSVVEKVRSSETICDDNTELINFTSIDISQDITKQYDIVKENIQRLQDLTELDLNDHRNSKANSISSIGKEELKHMPDEGTVHNYEYNLIAIWSRLVSFAYQVVQLNRGNCYYNYSSQFLTAVLACDVLRRGVSRMCHILQPYVSPIKFATDESDLSDSHINEKGKKTVQPKKSRKTCEYKSCPNKVRTNYKKYSSKKYSQSWQHFNKSSLESQLEEKIHASEPWRSVTKMSLKKNLSHKSSSSSSVTWREFPKDELSDLPYEVCSCRRPKAVNPMLKIASYIDGLLKDLDDEKCV